jgi:ABC-2 type transport system permease protein
MNALTTSLALARMSWHRQHAYRAANLAGLVTNLFFGFLRASVLVALFAARIASPHGLGRGGDALVFTTTARARTVAR